LAYQNQNDKKGIAFILKEGYPFLGKAAVLDADPVENYSLYLGLGA
jgi:hypothetical protein